MCKPYIRKQLANLVIGLSALSMIPCALAAKSDLDQEIMIKSARQSGDLKNKVISYLDDVVITQGSLVIRADIVQVMKKEQSDEDVYIAKGKPATFDQLLDDGTPIKLQADQIIYEASAHTIVISGNALLSQEGSEVRGSKIIYNTLTERLEAESYTNETVTTILKPKTKTND